MASDIKLQTTIDLTTRFIYNSPLLYLNSGVLAYSIGDWVREFLLAPPFAWRWNRAEISGITLNPGQTDYVINIPDFGWLERARILYPSAPGTPIQIYNSMNILSITANSNTVTAVVNGSPITAGFYIGQTISVQQVIDSSFDAFQSLVVTGLGANSITYTQFGTGASSSGGVVFYLTSSTIPTVTSQGQPLASKELTISDSLVSESVLGQPAYISVIKDDNNGNITFRLMMAPDQQYTLYLIYQKASPVFGSTQDTWEPIPDYFSYLYNLGFLAKAYEYKGDERFAFAHQEFLRLVTAANEGLLDSQKNLFLAPKITSAREQGAVPVSQQARGFRGGA